MSPATSQWMRDKDRNAERSASLLGRKLLPVVCIASNALRPPTSSPNSCANSGALAVQPDQRSNDTVIASVHSASPPPVSRASCPAIQAARGE